MKNFKFWRIALITQAFFVLSCEKQDNINPNLESKIASAAVRSDLDLEFYRRTAVSPADVFASASYVYSEDGGSIFISWPQTVTALAQNSHPLANTVNVKFSSVIDSRYIVYNVNVPLLYNVGPRNQQGFRTHSALVDLDDIRFKVDADTEYYRVEVTANEPSTSLIYGVDITSEPYTRASGSIAVRNVDSQFPI